MNVCKRRQRATDLPGLMDSYNLSLRDHLSEAVYWDFLDRHYDKLKDYARMQLQLRNVVRKREDKEAFKKLKTRE